MRRAVCTVVIAIFVTLALGAISTTPAGAALPTKGAKYSGTVKSGVFSGSVTFKVKGNNNKRFAKVVANLTCSESGAKVKLVYKNVRITTGGSFTKTKNNYEYLNGYVDSARKITGQLHTRACTEESQGNFVAKKK